MNRRQLIGALAATTGGLLPVRVSAQITKPLPRIVFFGSAIEANARGLMAALREGLADSGDVEGRDYTFSSRFAENRMELLPSIAAEVVASNPAVIVCGATDTVLAARQLTSTIPLVTGALADAEHHGLVVSYARPSRNVTGVMPYISGLPSKQIEIARELFPGLKIVGIVGNRNDPKAGPPADEITSLARSNGIRVVAPSITSPAEVEPAIAELKHNGVEVAIVLQTSMMLSLRKRIAEPMAEYRLPALYGYREHAIDGGLISYGIDIRWCYYRVGHLVHKIFKGTPVGEIPVEFPTSIQLVLNARAAQALDITFPATLTARADHVLD